MVLTEINLNSPISIGADSLSAQSDALGHGFSAPVHVLLWKIRSLIRIQSFFYNQVFQMRQRLWYDSYHMKESLPSFSASNGRLQHFLPLSNAYGWLIAHVPNRLWPSHELPEQWNGFIEFVLTNNFPSPFCRVRHYLSSSRIYSIITYNL